MTSSPPRPRILLVEDDLKIARLLVDCLEAEDLSVDVANNGPVAIDHIRHEPPALVLLDLTLPGLNGVVVCRSVRPFYGGRIIMLTARIDGIDRLVGLDSGGDGCVCKPFSPRAVMARVKAQLRMCKAGSRRRQTPGQSAMIGCASPGMAIGSTSPGRNSACFASCWTRRLAVQQPARQPPQRR